MKIVILDRDGVINQDSPSYIKSVDEWHPIPGALEAIARLCQAGFHVYVASNQSGIGRGLFDLDALFDIHERMQRALAELGARVEAIEFAPDHPDAASDMRKPGPGMLLDLARRLQISLDGVAVVGDSFRDLQAARSAGALPILVLTGNGERTRNEHSMDGVAIYADLGSFANDWIEQEQKAQAE